jgi:glycerate kinase
VSCLVDVTAPLLGPLGAARQFGPQKGADPDDVEVLEDRLAPHSSRGHRRSPT